MGTRIRSLKDKWIVCSLDILGYGDFIEQYYEDAPTVIGIEKLFDLLFKDLEGLSLQGKINVQFISDTIIIALNLNDLKDERDVIASLEHFFMFISHIFLELPTVLGKFVRGGVTVGMYHQSALTEPKNQFIFSKAFIDTYRLEKEANYPRVLLGDDLLEYLKGLNKFKTLEESWIERDVDFDGAMILNCYYYLAGSRSDFRKKILAKLRYVLSKQIANGSFEKKVLSKYIAFVRYHNKHIDKLEDSLSTEGRPQLQSCKIDLECLFGKRG